MIGDYVKTEVQFKMYSVIDRLMILYLICILLAPVADSKAGISICPTLLIQHTAEQSSYHGIYNKIHRSHCQGTNAVYRHHKIDSYLFSNGTYWFIGSLPCDEKMASTRVASTSAKPGEIEGQWEEFTEKSVWLNSFLQISCATGCRKIQLMNVMKEYTPMSGIYNMMGQPHKCKAEDHWFAYKHELKDFYIYHVEDKWVVGPVRCGKEYKIWNKDLAGFPEYASSPWEQYVDDDSVLVTKKELVKCYGCDSILLDGQDFRENGMYIQMEDMYRCEYSKEWNVYKHEKAEYYLYHLDFYWVISDIYCSHEYKIRAEDVMAFPHDVSARWELYNDDDGWTTGYDISINCLPDKSWSWLSIVGFSTCFLLISSTLLVVKLRNSRNVPCITEQILEPEICGICFIHPENVLLKCNHEMCISCFEEWRTACLAGSRNFTCPFCRSPLTYDSIVM